MLANFKTRGIDVPMSGDDLLPLHILLITFTLGTKDD